MTDLKPCPFCGSTSLENLDAAAQGGTVHCIDCGARGPVPYRAPFVRLEDDNCGLLAWNHRESQS